MAGAAAGGVSALSFINLRTLVITKFRAKRERFFKEILLFSEAKKLGEKWNRVLLLSEEGCALVLSEEAAALSE